MDDLQFRRSIYADPDNHDDELLAAMAADPTKQRFARELHEFNQRITSAASIPVPSGLKEKLLLKQSLVSHQQQKRKSRIYMGLAASFVAALGFTINMLHFSHAYNSMADYAVAHTNHEADQFHNDDLARVSLTSLNQKMATFNGQFNESPGELIAANFCRFDGMKSLHLIFKGQNTPVNIFIIPNADHLGTNDHFVKAQFKGVVQNYKGSKVIVVGDKQEPLEYWQHQLTKQIRWSA